ncbi:MAG TPA: ABC transporter permease [Clostridiales bacterium]|nr:ABC transporter permease [Clostridiales bacterium]
MCLKRGRTLLQYAISPAVWLGVWQLASMAVGMDLLLPSPMAVAASLWKLAGTPQFWLSALFTLGRVCQGVLGGVALGSALALLTHFTVWGERIFAPAIRVMRATPVVSFILLVYLWVDRATIPAVVAGLMVLPILWGNLTVGLESVDRQLLELARAYRFGRWKTLRLIYLPSLRTHFASGLLNAFGLAWKSGVAAEVICPPALAIGSRIQQAKVALETPELFAWTLVIVALSLGLEGILRRVVHPREERGQ